MCGKPLSSVFGYEGQPETDRTWTEPYNQPYGGTVFSSRGHYGSTVYDPMPYSQTHIELTICDDCLTKHKENVLHVRVVNDRTRYRVTGWDPDERN